MKIGIDTRMPFRQKTGMGYLSSNLIRELVVIAEKRDDSIVFVGDDIGITSPVVSRISVEGILKKALNFIWRYFNFHYLKESFDVFLFPNFLTFPVRARKKIVVIGDLSYIHFPDLVERKNRNVLSRGVPRSIASSSHVVAISDFIRNQIMDEYKVDPYRVTTVHLSCNSAIKRETDMRVIDLVKDSFGIHGEYMLSVGTVEPRKNYSYLIECFSDWAKRSGSDLKLVIAGKKTDYFKELHDKCIELDLGDRVIFTDYLSEGDLSSLYSGARCSIFSSLYEGFGIPLVEAMRCGSPVLASDIPVFREVADDAAVYFTLGDKDSFYNSLLKVLNNDSIREGLVKRGLKRSGDFSWSKAAELVYAVITKNS